jgi:RND family efflux transporter MFP subunit
VAVTLVTAPTSLAEAGRSVPDNQVRGIVKAEAEATISSELVATIIRIPYRPGQQFARGAPIVQYDCRRYIADLAGATAEAAAAEQTVVMNNGLRRRQAIGAHELAISLAKLDQAKARIQSFKVQTGQCTIRAPYDGYVTEQFINEFEMPQPNTPLLRIVKKGGLKLGLIVPSQWLNWLEPDLVFGFHVEETNANYSARILRVGAIVDPISRTATIEAELIAPSRRVRPGMSGTATFTIPEEASAK